MRWHGHDAWLCNFRLTKPNVIDYTFYARVCKTLACKHPALFKPNAALAAAVPSQQPKLAPPTTCEQT